MTGFALSFLLLFTIIAAFAFGIAAGYWVICGILNFFRPAPVKKPQPKQALASSGD